MIDKEMLNVVMTNILDDHINETKAAWAGVENNKIMRNVGGQYAEDANACMKRASGYFSTLKRLTDDLIGIVGREMPSEWWKS